MVLRTGVEPVLIVRQTIVRAGTLTKGDLDGIRTRNFYRDRVVL